MKKQKVYYLFWVVCLFMQSEALFCQNFLDFTLPDATLSGRVLSDDDKLLPLANILLTSTLDSTSYFRGQSDREGHFKLSIPMGIYFIKVSYTGFQSYESKVSLTEETRLPDIVLHVGKGTFLEEVRVVARSITYDAKGYKVNVSGNRLMREQSLDNVIRMLPGVMAGLENIELYGREVMVVYINDRKVSLSGKNLQDYLKTFKGSNIKSIQAIASSGVEEDASVLGKASLRIYTMGFDDGGRISVGLTGSRNPAGYNWRSPSMNLQWRLGKWSAYINATGGYHVRDNDKRVTYTDYTETGTVQDAAMETYSLANRIYEVFGIGYDFSKNHIITLEQSFRYHKTDNNKFSQTWISSAAHSAVSEELGSWNGFDKSIRHTISGTYLYRFDEGRIEVTSSYTDSDVDTRQEQKSENSLASQSYTGNSVENQNYKLYIGNVGLVKGLRNEKDEFQAGLSYTSWNQRNHMNALRLLDGVPDEYGNYTDVYKYKEQVWAAYASYDWKYKRWHLLAGLRVEHLLLSPLSQINPERNRSSRYTDFFPNVAVNYVINRELGHNVNVEYSRSIDRPRMELMNPSIRWMNEYSYTMGNPYLIPNYTHQGALRMNLFNRYVFTADYSRSELYQSVYGKEQDSDVSYSTTVNGGRNDKFSLFAGAGYNILSNCQLNFGAVYAWARSRYESESVENNHWGCSLSLMGKLPQNLDIYAYVYYQSPTRDVYCRNSHSVLYIGRLSRSFLDERLEVSLDVSGLSKPYGHITSPSYTYSTHGVWSDYSLSLSLKYTIRWGNRNSNVRKNLPGNQKEMMRMVCW